MSDFWLHCDNCKRTDVGVTWVNGFRYCGKCYQETFGNTNPFEKELRDKISDLEAKLAEAQETNKILSNELTKNTIIKQDHLETCCGIPIFKIPKLKEENEQLKQQLAEKDEQIENLNKEWVQSIHDWKEIVKNKDKENSELVFVIEEMEQFAWEQLNNENFDKYKAYDEMLTKIKQLTKQSTYEQHNQDKISFAVEQLEKVKENIDCYMAIREGDLPYNIECLLIDFADKIDNQINVLRNNKDGIH